MIEIVRLGCVVKDNASEARRIVNEINLRVSLFLVGLGRWRVIALDASQVTDDDIRHFPEVDHAEILRQRKKRVMK